MTRSWGLHVIVLVSLLAVSLASLALATTDKTSFALAYGFFWIPLAVVYSALSTLVVAVLPPGRRWVALAHTLALILGTLAPMFFLASSPR